MTHNAGTIASLTTWAKLLSFARFKQRIRELKAEAFALYLAARHPAMPWHIKLLVAAIVAYAFSPIDLIPDFIPVLGLLDDLILLPLGIALAIKLIPPAVMTECRAQAAQAIKDQKPASRIAAAVIAAIWLGVLVIGALSLLQVAILTCRANHSGLLREPIGAVRAYTLT